MCLTVAFILQLRNFQLLPIIERQGFPGGSDSKESACNTGDTGSIPGLGRSSGEGNGYPLQLFLLGDFQGQRILVGYSP